MIPMLQIFLEFLISRQIKRKYSTLTEHHSRFRFTPLCINIQSQVAPYNTLTITNSQNKLKRTEIRYHGNPHKRGTSCVLYIRVHWLRWSQPKGMITRKKGSGGKREAKSNVKKQNCKINWAGRRTVSGLSERCICFTVKSDSHQVSLYKTKKKRKRRGWARSWVGFRDLKENDPFN